MLMHRRGTEIATDVILEDKQITTNVTKLNFRAITLTKLIHWSNHQHTNSDRMIKLPPTY